MSRKLTRRDFLKLSSITIGAAAFTTLSPTDLRLAQPQTSLGRVVVKPPNKAQVLDRPNRLGTRIGYKEPNEVVTIYRAVVGEGFYPHNHVWFEIPEGYIYSTIVQPVTNLIQTPLTALPPGGFFAEVCVPYTSAHLAPDPTAGHLFFGADEEHGFPGDSNLYFSVVLKIKGIQAGADGQVWYEVDDENLNFSYWALGKHLRIIGPDEIAPLSPDVTDKRVVANLDTHWISAFDGTTEVYRTRFASGSSWFDLGSKQQLTYTPSGDYQISWKRISRHMEGGGGYPNGYDLPGIGWVSTWHSNGAAIHSTYWHNSYGIPRSHGCLNCSPAAAKWLFRWLSPIVHYEGGEARSSGTRVTVIGTPPPVQDNEG